MLFKRLCLTSAVASAVLMTLFCSRSDVITDAGRSVITDIDSTLANHSRGFVTVTLDGMIVADSSFSLPAEPDPLFGTFYSVQNTPIGISRDGDTLAAQTQFSVTGGAPYAINAAKPPAPYAVRFDSAFICFRSVDTASSDITLFLSGPLPYLIPVNRSDTLHTVPVCDSANCTDTNKVGTFKLGKPDSLVQIALHDSLAKRIFDRRMTLDTDSSEYFAFCIPNYTDSLLWIRNPYIIVRAYVFQHNIDDSVLVYDTLTAVTRYTAFENGEAAAVRKDLSYSSQFTRRTAVFRVDMSKVVDTLASLGLSADNTELLNAVAAVWHEREVAGDSAGRRTGLKSRDVRNYKAVISDSLLERETILNPDFSVNSRPLYDEFAKVGSTALRSEYFNTHSFKPAFRKVLDKYRRGEIPKPYIYIYLRPVPDGESGGGSAILWRKPLKIETVFTPSRP